MSVEECSEEKQDEHTKISDEVDSKIVEPCCTYPTMPRLPFLDKLRHLHSDAALGFLERPSLLLPMHLPTASYMDQVHGCFCPPKAQVIIQTRKVKDRVMMF